MRIMKWLHPLLAALVAAGTLGLSACNTIEGAGEDIEAAGEEIEEAGEGGY